MRIPDLSQAVSISDFYYYAFTVPTLTAQFPFNLRCSPAVTPLPTHPVPYPPGLCLLLGCPSQSFLPFVKDSSSAPSSTSPWQSFPPPWNSPQLFICPCLLAFIKISQEPPSCM